MRLGPDVLHPRYDQVARSQDHTDCRRADADDQHHLEGAGAVDPQIAEYFISQDTHSRLIPSPERSADKFVAGDPAIDDFYHARDTPR